jgi:hypothetical protein
MRELSRKLMHWFVFLLSWRGEVRAGWVWITSLEVVSRDLVYIARKGGALRRILQLQLTPHRESYREVFLFTPHF